MKKYLLIALFLGGFVTSVFGDSNPCAPTMPSSCYYAGTAGTASFNPSGPTYPTVICPNGATLSAELTQTGGKDNVFIGALSSSSTSQVCTYVCQNQRPGSWKNRVCHASQ